MDQEIPVPGNSTIAPGRRNLPVIAAFAVGLLLAFSAFEFTLRHETEDRLEDFEQDAHERVGIIQAGIARYLESLVFTASFFDASSHVSREEFETFAGPILRRHRGIRALEWIPRVAASERETYEAAPRRAGHPDFRFTARDGQGNTAPAPAAGEYFPVYYVEPFAGNEAAFGFDLGSEPARLAALEMARDSGVTVVSARITLVQDPDGGFGFLAFHPVYRPGTQTGSVAQRRENLMGFILGVFNIQDVVGTSPAFLGEDTRELDVTLFDTTAQLGQQLLYPRDAPFAEAADVGFDVSLSIPLDVGGRAWLAVLTPPGGALDLRVHWLAWGVLAAGLTLNLLFAAYFRNVSRGRTETEKLVAQRTAALSEANADLREREERINAVVENVVEAIITIDTGGRIETFNRVAEDLFGYAADDVIGENVRLLMPEPYRDGHDLFIRSYLDTGEAKVIGTSRELTGQRKDGTTFPMELSIGEMQVRGERHFTGVVRDITERKRVEKMKNEFVSVVSHELRTPLTSIQGSLGLLLGGIGGELPSQSRSLIKIAHNNSDRLVRLINDILDVEKIEAGKMVFAIGPHNMVELAGHAVATNRAFAERYGVSLVLDGAAERSEVMVDPDRFMQIMSNLISNAVKFSPEGGEVRVTITGSGSIVRTAVSDRGDGIPEDFRAAIFGKFAQAQSSDNRQKGGTGLGLSISQAIVERMNGTIDFESETGVGTTFWFDLPATGISGSAAPVVSDRPADILICENNPRTAKVFASLLARGGYTCDIAYTTIQAKALLTQRRYQAITIDVRLSDSMGVSLIHDLRDAPATRDLAIVMVSLNLDGENENLSGEAIPIADWLVKPVDRERLLTSVVRTVLTHAQGKPRVLHVEDDKDLSTVVATMLDSVADVTWASTVALARAKLSAEIFDLIILDVTLPDGTGLELLGKLNSIVAPVPVLIFAGSEDPETTAERVAGALVKTHCTSDDILATIDVVLNPEKLRSAS